MKDFALAVVHTSPDYAVREVDALFDVWEDAKQRLLMEVHFSLLHYLLVIRPLHSLHYNMGRGGCK